MVDKQAVLNSLYEIIDEVNRERAEDDQLSKASSTILFGKDATLDSMDLVQLIVLYEQTLQELTATSICITDDRAWSYENSPFHTVESLVGYVMDQLQEEANDA